jgi:hypothetical protein
MRVLAPVIEIPTLAVLHPRKDLALRGPVAFEFIGDDHPWDVLTAFEQLAKELLRGLFVAPPLYEDVQDVVGLIHRAPEIVAFAIDC